LVASNWIHLQVSELSISTHCITEPTILEYVCEEHGIETLESIAKRNHCLAIVDPSKWQRRLFDESVDGGSVKSGNSVGVISG